jgi:hypothetical protein
MFFNINEQLPTLYLSYVQVHCESAKKNDTDE